MRILSTFIIIIVSAVISIAQNTKYNLSFSNNEIEINDRVRPTLNEISNVLTLNKQLILNIASENNINSEHQLKRIKNISNYLVSKGIDLYRITTKIKIAAEQDNVIEILINEISSEIVAINEPNEKKIETTSTRNSNISAGDVVISNLFFGFDKDYNNEYYSNLDKLANYLINNPEVKIEIQGYSDLQGDASYNLDLSYRRADFAKQYIVKKGCNTENIKVRTLGEKNQISTNESPESRKYNRRVEFVVLNQGKTKLIVETIVVPAKYQL
jgi:outer membrane protein OmpA-like peptidoglycan-associated protein